MNEYLYYSIKKRTSLFQLVRVVTQIKIKVCINVPPSIPNQIPYTNDILQSLEGWFDSPSLYEMIKYVEMWKYMYLCTKLEVKAQE